MIHVLYQYIMTHSCCC